MTAHLSPLQIKQLCASALPKDALAAAAVHTVECQSCHQRFVEELRPQRGWASFNFTLEPQFWFRDDHVDFDQLVALADKTLDPSTEEIINIHLPTCEVCREDVRGFLAFRTATAREMNISYGPTRHTPAGDVAPVWWQHFQPRPIHATAATVLAVVLLIGLITLNKSSGPSRVSNQQQTSFNGAPGIFPPSAWSAKSENRSAYSNVAVSIKDAGGELTIYRSGRVIGFDELSQTSRQYIALAALSEQIEPPDVLRRLSGEQSGSLSYKYDRPPFNLMYPVRRVVTEDRPIFQWDGLPDASSYRVYVVDAEGNHVQSEELTRMQTQWRAPPLRRGQVFSWAVTAMVDGKKVVSPSSSAGEMRFAVLSSADFQELASLKRSNSHFALGVFYGRNGLLDEAEREFESLINLNADLGLPRKMLQSVRNMKRKN